jgi:cellulose synthase/poly-beta-1,6-N-acetylglucosamine synthase-like glycosyltransferase
MRTLALVLVALAGALPLAAYLGYPLMLRMLRARGRRIDPRLVPLVRYPFVTIVLVVRNAEHEIRRALLNLLSLAYPSGLRRILVVSNGSTDFTDAVVRAMSHPDVTLIRMMRPKPAAYLENAVRSHVRGDVVVVTDVHARPKTWSLAALAAAFAEPSVGVAYGREVPGDAAEAAREAESPFRRYEAWLREQETRVFGTVSARGSWYAVREDLYQTHVPPSQRRDFAMALRARSCGLRSVWVPSAECVLDAHASSSAEFGRRVRVLSREIVTLLARPTLLNPLRYGVFAWMLLGHKLARWLMPWGLLGGVTGLAILAPTDFWALALLAGLLGAVATAAAVRLLPALERNPVLSAPARFVTAFAATALATLRALYVTAGLMMVPPGEPVLVRGPSAAR